MFQIIKNPEYGVFYYWTLITKTMQASVLVRKQTFKNKNSLFSGKWLRGPDLNQRPSGYEPDELPSCSTPRPIFNKRKQTRYLLSRLRIIRLKLRDAIVLKPKNADYFLTAYFNIKY